jgi:diguanylate cyclase (GGDEF)-like protein
VSAPHAFASELLAGAIELAEGTGGAVASWHEEAGRILAVAGDDGGPAIGREFGPLESELALAARSGAEIVRAPREGRGALPVGAPGELWLRQPRAVVALPLATHSSVTGALAVWTSIRRDFDPDALDLLRTVAPYAALQLEQAMEYGRLHDSADRDPLTGLRNRRAFDRALEREAARLERYGHPIGLLAVDIDHFKQINDRFGHEAGDAILKDLARLLEAGIRDVDVAARFGGEEFVVLLPETDLAAALEVGERLRAAVESMKKEWNGEPLPVRISVGCSASPACVPDPKLLVRSADAALYQAKREGRNRVVRAAPAG